MERLKKLSEESALTKGASFMVTYRKGEWKVNFVNIGQSFTNPDLGEAVESATRWLMNHRSDAVEVHKQYELKLK